MHFKTQSPRQPHREQCHRALMKFPAQMSLVKSRPRGRSAVTALLCLQYETAPFYGFKRHRNVDLSWIETDWMWSSTSFRGLPYVIETLPCFIIWIEHLCCVIKGDGLSMIVLYIIAWIIIYIWLRFIFPHSQMKTLKVWGWTEQKGQGWLGAEGWGWARRGEARRGEASCWVQGWRACKRSQWAVKISPIAALSKDSSLSPNRSHTQSAVHSGQ